MRSSSDYFNRDYSSFNNLNSTFISRPSIPLFPDKITIKKSQLPTIQYPIFTPVQQPPSISSLEQIKKEVDKKVTDLQKNKPTLDQIIQNALKQKVAQDYKNATQKIVSIKKMTPHLSPTSHPSTPQKADRQFYWPSEQEVQTQKQTQKRIIKKVTNSITPIKIQLPTPEKINSNLIIQNTPFKTIKTPLWQQLLAWIGKEKVKLFIPKAKIPKAEPAKATPILIKTNIPSSIRLKPEFKTPVRTIPVSHPLQQNSKNLSQISPTSHFSNNPLNYFLFIINPESDPYDDTYRQKIIYGLKSFAYLVVLGGIFELSRNIKIGMSLNGTLEVMGIFLISGIFFFFGENLNVLLKPLSPYQVHETY